MPPAVRMEASDLNPLEMFPHPVLVPCGTAVLLLDGQVLSAIRNVEQLVRTIGNIMVDGYQQILVRFGEGLADLKATQMGANEEIGSPSNLDGWGLMGENPSPRMQMIGEPDERHENVSMRTPPDGSVGCRTNTKMVARSQMLIEDGLQTRPVVAGFFGRKGSSFREFRRRINPWQVERYES